MPMPPVHAPPQALQSCGGGGLGGGDGMGEGGGGGGMGEGGGGGMGEGGAAGWQYNTCTAPLAGFVHHRRSSGVTQAP